MKYDYTKSNMNIVQSRLKNVKNIIPKYANYTDAQLKRLSEELKEKISKTQANGGNIEEFLDKAVAICYCATHKAIGVNLYDTQLIAALAMKDNVIAEMKTGEGKTYVQIIVAYLNYLTNGHVHIFTSNDYLAQRDMEENSKVFNLLGISCGCVLSNYENRKEEIETKKEQYKKDIVYGTISTFGFDYLFDNEVYLKDDKVNSHPFSQTAVICDEADSVLIDDATTPLIVSSNQDKSILKEKIYTLVNNIISENIEKYKVKKFLKESNFKYTNIEEMEEDIAIFLDSGKVWLKDKFIKNMNRLIINDIGQDIKKYINKKISQIDLEILIYKIIEQCILARKFYEDGKHYTIRQNPKDNRFKVILTDQNTGRNLYSSKYTNGLQQAIEAYQNEIYQKKGIGEVELSNFNNMTSKISYPSFINLYSSKCGMTGTSDKEEFDNLYGFDTFDVPTLKPSVRIDHNLEVYKTKKDKYIAILKEVSRVHKTGRPILIGTTSVKESEELSKLFNKNGFRHSLLNAKVESKKEANIVATAGLFGSITIATNMAGRGTDIKLGKGVKQLGGLYVIASSINESKRIDDQLKGRCARQGEPGESKSFSSLEDDISYKFFPNKFINSAIEYITSSKLGKWYSKRFLAMQRIANSVEQANRLNNNKKEKVLGYQMQLVYDFRDQILNSNNIQYIISECIDKYVDDYVSKFDTTEVLHSQLSHLININYISNLSLDNIKKTLKAQIKSIDKQIILSCLDDYWNTQMYKLDELQNSIDFVSYIGKNPEEEYINEAMKLFNDMKEGFFNEVITYSLKPNLEYGSYLRELEDDKKGIKL